MPAVHGPKGEGWGGGCEEVGAMGSPAILVAVRKRPVMRHERDKGGVDVVQTEPGGVSLVVNEPKVRYDLTKYTEKHNYVFDRSFDESENNAYDRLPSVTPPPPMHILQFPSPLHRTVYREVVRPLLDTFFAAGNATCFAYGQTGSGKTHTMLGDRRRDKGIYLLAAEDIFRGISLQERSVFVSFYEIYGRKIFDLLNDKNRLVVREDGDKQINICGLSEHCVRSVDAVMRLMEEGSGNRSEGVTGANAESSRSHAVLRIEMRSAASNRSLGMLHFIDLAGNERGSDTRDCDRQTRIEGAEINKSLLALKECIRALGMGKSHVPFRGSVLTEVLRSSFIGNSRTTMIANISPSSTNCEHTLNTLRYTDRVKGLGKKDEKKGAGGRRPVAGRRMDPQPAAAAAPAAAPRLKEMPAKQKNMGEDVMQIVRVCNNNHDHPSPHLHPLFPPPPVHRSSRGRSTRRRRCTRTRTRTTRTTRSVRWRSATRTLRRSCRRPRTTWSCSTVACSTRACS